MGMGVGIGVGLRLGHRGLTLALENGADGYGAADTRVAMVIFRTNTRTHLLPVE